MIREEERECFVPVQVKPSPAGWQVQAKAGWRKIRHPLMASILDTWPDAEVSIRVQVPRD